MPSTTSYTVDNSVCGSLIINGGTGGRTITGDANSLEAPYVPPTGTTATILGAIGTVTPGASGFTPADIDTIIGTLKTSLYPTLPSNPTDADISGYMIKDTKFVNAIKSEYCHYYQRYAYGINQLLDSIINSNSKDLTTNQNPFNDTASGSHGLNTVCKNLNAKLNKIAYFVKGVTDYRKTITLPQIKSSLNDLNVKLSDAAESLTKQKKILTSAQTNVQLYKEMEQYSREKSKYTNNMLMLYSFLNITALGLLFYIYRSAGQ